MESRNVSRQTSPQLQGNRPTGDLDQENRSSHRQFYRLNEYIGTESRSLEFKKGPTFMQRDLRENVSKYMCGFVNSGVNGTIKVGINDDGTVIGYAANHREADVIYKTVDEAMKDIRPEIFPKDYSVKFVPVRDERGVHEKERLWVIEMSVSGADIEKEDGNLYSTSKGVFIRRDGSLQGPVNVQTIKEHVRRHYQKQIDNLKDNTDSLIHQLESNPKDNSSKDARLKERDKELQMREKKILVTMESQIEKVQMQLESFGAHLVKGEDINNLKNDLHHKDKKIVKNREETRRLKETITALKTQVKDENRRREETKIALETQHRDEIRRREMKTAGQESRTKKMQTKQKASTVKSDENKNDSRNGRTRKSTEQRRKSHATKINTNREFYLRSQVKKGFTTCKW